MTSIIIYAVVFLSITIAITASIKVENESFKPSKVKIMVINKDGDSSLIDGFLKYLGKYASFVEPKDNEDDIKEALFFKEVQYVLTIPEGFKENFQNNEPVQLGKQIIPNSIEAIAIDNAVDNYFNMARVYLKDVPNIDYDKLNSYLEKNLAEETQVNLNVEVKDDVTYSNGYNMNFFNYLGYIIISAFITGVSLVMFFFQGIDIRRRHSASPITSRSMNMQLIFANMIFVFVYLLIFIIASYVLNRNRMINANTLLTWLNALVFSLTALSISYLVGIAVTSRKAIQAISTALSLSLAFIIGIFVPQEYLGAPVLRVASFTPTYWYVKANNEIFLIKSLKISEISHILGYMGIQLGFAAAIISIALVVSKRKRQQAF
jgi:ABC-2 type transport system permease protein